MNKKESNTNEQHYDNPWIFDSNIFNSIDMGVVTGSSMSSQTNALDKSISDANTLFKNENLDVEVGDVRVKATGRITMEVVQILSEILRSTERNVLQEEYSPYIPPLERQTMKRHDNFLPTMY